VRKTLAGLQREIGKAGDIVTEGRDQGTVVFPDAECKIFLTATREERAKRRYLDLLKQGESITYGEVLDSQDERDAGDEQRDVGPLVMAPDAVEVITDDMSQDEVLVHLEWVVHSRGRKS
jgi:cytidylate kinase